MPRYFIHARHGDGFSLDPIGVELADPSPIEEMILAVLTERGVKLESELVVEVLDETGQVVKVIRIKDVPASR